jgi:hypothetical protein
MPVVLGFLAAAAILGVVGLIRAVSEYGVPGLMAFLKLAAAPAALVAGFAIFVVPRYPGEGWKAYFPTGGVLKAFAILAIALTGIAFGISASLGVGWLVGK